MVKKVFSNAAVLMLVAGVASGYAHTTGCYYFIEEDGTNFTCPQTKSVEMYRDQLADNTTKIVCCPPGDPYLKSFLGEANCRMSDCISESYNKDQCAAILKRTINGTKLEYEEIFKEPCSINGTAGKTSLCCTKDSPEGRLVTTLGAELNEFPHMVKIRPAHCGGTIYNHRWILTAAHCVTNLTTGEITHMSELEIVLGSNSGQKKGNDFVFGVTRIIVHPKYSHLKNNSVWVRNATTNKLERNDTRQFNDIAVLELDRNITFGSNRKVLEIAPKYFKPLDFAKRAVIVGWGTTDSGELPIHLQKANFIIRSDKACFTDDDEKQVWGPHWDINEYQDQLLCLGGVLDGKWSPTAGGGDSGGPSVCRDSDGTAVLCGITSFGGSDELCLEHNNEEFCVPSVYADVSYFHQWIVDNAGPQPKDRSVYYKPYLYGKPVSKGEAEHQVHITSATGIYCGGTLIDKDVVVTAANCVWDMKAGKKHPGLRITTGITNLIQRSGLDFQVKGNPKLLPNFGSYVFPVDVKKQGNRVIMPDPFYMNDLAVVKLTGMVNIAAENIPILPKQKDTFTQGTEFAFPRGIESDIYGGSSMMTRNFTLLDSKDCQRRFDRLKSANLFVTVGKKMLCGVEKYSGGSTCDREQGGGLICKKGGKMVLCGVQVFRLCEWSIPNGFINVAEVSDFIKGAKASFRFPSKHPSWYNNVAGEMRKASFVYVHCTIFILLLNIYS